jgi:hypothetical protein
MDANEEQIDRIYRSSSDCVGTGKCYWTFPRFDVGDSH